MNTYPKAYLYKRIVQAKLFIDAHFGEQIDLDNISDEAHFSRFHFIRLFKTAYGKTPHQYLTWVRIEKAKELLEKGNTITEVCFSVGFDSIGSFSDLFKRCTKQSPSVYRKQHMLRQASLKASPLKYVPNCFAAHHGWDQKSNFQESIT